MTADTKDKPNAPRPSDAQPVYPEKRAPRDPDSVTEAPATDASEDVSVASPLGTDDNDDPHADASGDSEDETPDENKAPDEWLKGEP